MFSERIKELRKGAGLTQAQFAQQFNIATGTIGMWETGMREPDTKTAAKIARFFRVSIGYLVGEEPRGSGVLIPVLGKVQAGLPIEAIEDVLDYEEISPHLAATGDFFALQVRGNSMEPRMVEGDVVVVRKQSFADSGDTVVALVNGNEATVKRLKIMQEGIMLIANNSAYEPLFYTNKEIEHLPISILGKVVELRGKF